MSAPAKVKKGPSAAFGADEIIVLENGVHVRVNKWSVRKAMAMGKSLASVMKRIFVAIEARGEENVSIADIIGLLPELMDECATELVFIIAESLTTEDGPQVTTDDVYDKFTLEDFADVLGAIIHRNVTERMMGKWGRLLQGLPMLKATEPEPPRKSKKTTT